MAGFWDEVTQGIGDAIADIRQQVVERGWFGREVTGANAQRGQDASPAEALGWDMPQPSFDEQWRVRESGNVVATHDIEGHDIQDHAIDR